MTQGVSNSGKKIFEKLQTPNNNKRKTIPKQEHTNGHQNRIITRALAT